jgi:hypothetical protein
MLVLLKLSPGRIYAMAIMTIIIKAIDKASEVAVKVGNATKGQMDKIAQATDRARQAGDRFTGAVVKTGQSGMSAYAQLSNAQQEYINKVTKASGLLDRMGLSGSKAGNAILKGFDLVNNGVNRVRSGVETLKQRIESTTVGNKLITGFNTVKNKVTEVVQKIRTGFAQALDNAKNKVENLSNSMGELGMAVSSVFGALGLGSIYQATIGLAMTREQMTSLMTATMGSSDAAKGFVGYLDQMTNKSLVSLNDLGSAMSKIKMSTGMTNDQLKLIAPTVNDIGQRAILMGYDTAYAQELMVASFRGLNGEFDMLNTNFGITRQALLDAGWSGAATDVEGYNAALQKVLENGGSMEGMLQTTPGQIALLKKAFSTAGREIGEIFIPVIQSVLAFMLELKKTNPIVFKLIIVFGALISAFALALPVLGGVIGGFKSLLMFLGVINATQGATTLSTIRDTAARWLNTASINANTTAENAGILAKVRARAVELASAAATAIRTAAVEVQTGMTASSMATLAAMTGVTNVNTAAQNAGALTYIRATASLIAQRAAQIAGAAATWVMTAAQTALNAVMNANPIMLVVIAIVALIAILFYLYNTNETVRNAINWLFDGLKQLGAWIWGGLIAAWNALTSALAPVGAALQQLGGAILGRLMDAWNGLLSMLQPLIDAFGKLWAALGKLWAALSGGASSGANDTFSQLWDILNQVWSVIVQLAEIFWSTFGPAIMMVAGIVQDFFGAALQTVFGILGAIIEYIATLITILADLIAGNITFEEAMGKVWNATGTLVMQVLTAIITGIGQFAIELVQKGVTAAQNFLTGIITWLSQLPGKAWALLLLVIAKALAWRNQMIARAKDAGTNFVNNVINFLKTLPGKAWTWFLNTLSRIVSFASQAYSRATTVGSNIINAIASYLSSLPGRMYQWGVNAINSFINAIINAIPGLRSALDMVASLFPHSPPKEGPLATITTANMEAYGESLGEAFAAGINNTTGDIFSNLTPPGPVDIPVATSPVAGAVAAMPSQSVTTTIGMDTTGLAAGSGQAQAIVAGTVSFANEQYGQMQQNIGNTWNQMATITQTGFSGIQSNMQTTLNQIVANNQAGYQRIQGNTASTLTALLNDNRTKYNSIQKNMSSTLTTITNDNKSKYTSILNTTKSTLGTLQSKTNQSMGEVKKSWNGMRTSLISAASQVRSQTTSEINRLSSNIGTFYRKIRNPILFLAGPMPYRYQNRPMSSLPRGRFAGPGPGSSGSSSEIRKLDSAPAIPCQNPLDCYYAGWDYSDPWYRTIMQYVNNYRPTFGDLGNMGLTVGSFKNSTFPIMGNMQAFDAVARKLIGGTRYSFYFNSRGSPYQMAQSGAFNCWDGAMIMLALANAFGLSGYMAHGYWGDIGHVWAVINGKTYDTTAYQGGYGWSSPKVHAGPAPSSFSTTTASGSNVSELEIHETLDLNLTLQFEDLPDSIDEESLKSWLMSVINDSELVRKLVKDRGFQEWLKIEMKKTEMKDKRVAGS